MNINKFGDWIDRLYAVIRPILFFLIIQLLVFVVLVLMPQSHDVYVFLFEDGLLPNILQIILLFVAIICLCLTSGVGSKLLYCFGNIKMPQETEDEPNDKVDLLKNNPKSINQKLEKMMLGIVTTLFYFPIFSLFIGFVRTFIKGDIPRSHIVILLLALGLCGWIVFVVRGKLRDYVLDRLAALSKDKKYPSPTFLSDRYDGLDNILTSPKGEAITYTFSKDYEPVFKIVCIFFSLAISTFVFIAFMPANIYVMMGSASLIIFGFACWITFYYGIEVIDKTVMAPLDTKFLKVRWNLKRILFALLMISSYFNQDHPLRYLENPPLPSTVTLAENYKLFKSQFAQDSAKRVPIIFVAIDGGANRTGAWSGIMLSKIQDSTSEFNRHIFGISSISGGTLGGNFFNMLGGIDKKEKKNIDFSKRFFNQDFLSPVVGTFLFGEILGYLMPFHIEKFDRGIALEKGWEDQFFKINEEFGLSPNNPMRNSVTAFTQFPKDSFKTAIFINTHEVETGNRAIWSNMALDSSFAGITNMNLILKRDIRYSSAILLSARFPGISPAAMIEIDENKRRHFVDGGYFEASGTLTLYEAMRALEKEMLDNKNDIYVIHCKFDADEEEKENNGIRFLNEVSEIVNGGVNDKSGHGRFAVENLKNYVEKKLNGTYIELKVGKSAKDVPMNWVLSTKAIEELEKQSIQMFSDKKLSKLVDSLKHTKKP